MMTYPLLDSQQGVLLSCSSLPATTAWNLPSAIVFDKTISAERLIRALQDICRTRTELHVQFTRTEEGTVRQYADAAIPIPIVHSKMSDEEAEKYMEGGFTRPFQLFSSQSLCRFEVVETESRTLLLSDFHHSIADGFTIAGRFIGSDLPAAYGGEMLHQPMMSLFQWAQREQEAMKTPAYARAKSYYQSLFADEEVTQLPAKGAAGYGKGIMASTFLPMKLVDEWCVSRNIAVYHFLMASFCLTLSKLSHRRKVVFCTLNHGRYDKRLSEAYGMFVNTMPFVASIEPDMTIGMLVGQVRKRLAENHRHRTYPFTHFCADMGFVPKITFGFQSNGILEQAVVEGCRYKGMQLPHPDSQSDLSVMVYSSGEDYEIRVEASDALYDKDDLEKIGYALRNCICHLMAMEDCPIGGIDLVDERQKVKILDMSAGEKTAHEPLPTIVGMFLHQTVMTPDAVAVDDTYNSLTYRELEIRSRTLAHKLKAEGVKKGSFVGIDTTPCCEFLVAALAVMRAGGAYVPVESQLPPQRRNHIINEAGLRIVIDAGYVRAHALPDGDTPEIDYSTPQGTAYMIFTSGSSGMPKGVVIRHAGLSNLVCFCARRWPLNFKSRISCHSNLAFDASVEDLFPVLSVGGCLVFVPSEVRMDLDELALFIQRQQITGGCFTTRLGVALAEAHPISMDYYCLGGEQLLSSPRISGRVYNTYGPTEFTVDATYYELKKDKQYDNIPIGRPVDNCHAFVVDPYGCLLPQGMVGELWLAGPQIAAGYWNAPELTAGKFTACCFYNGTVFHTGDLARWNDDGLLEYVGRTDNQVKIDGFRVALEEIEQHILEVPGVEEAAAVAVDLNGKPQIHAFFTATDSLTEKEVITRLQDYLPQPMMPKHLVKLDKMPLTSSGKIDKRNLYVETSHVSVTPPANTAEWVFCQLMADVLGVDNVGTDDNFFAMGGTSISAMQLTAEARKCGYHLAYADIFSHPTPKQLGDCVRWNDTGHGYDADNYDYSDINRFLSQETFPSQKSFPDGGTLLLTGATGFLGIHLLAKFVASKGWRTICLMRGSDKQKAWERLQDRWSFYFGSQPLDPEKVSIVCGDLTEPASIEQLAGKPFDIVINCAADVRFFVKDNNIIQVNTEGVRRLVELCLKNDARLMQVSTLSIAGFDSCGNLSQISPMSFDSRHLPDQYSYSKFLAERDVLERMANDGLKANIVRVGYLGPRSTDGKCQINASENMLTSLLELMAEMGGCPEYSSRIEITWAPVDEVAACMFDWATTCTLRPVMHVDGLRRCSLKRLADIYAERELTLFSDEDFKKLLYRQNKTGIWVHLVDELTSRRVKE